MPYTPTVQDRTGEFLMRGITGAADALKERKQKSQRATSLRKTIVVYHPELKDEVQTMGLADLEGYVAGIGLKAAKDQLAQEQSNKDREFNLSKVYAELQQGQLARTNQRDAAGQRFMGSLAELGQAAQQPSMDFANTLAGEPGTGELSLAQMMQAGSRAGIGPEQFAALAPMLRADAMDRRQDRPQWGGPDIKVLINPVTGEEVPVFLDGPNQASLMPSGEMTANQRSQALRGLRSERRRLIAARAEAFDTSEKQDITNELRALDQDIQEMGGAAAPADAAGGGEPVPMPKSKDQLKAGQVYQTARGPARWNGNAFEPIQ